MRLTSVRAENLLSFASLDFEVGPGLNVVVGPNGVGKSNLARAIGLVTTALDVSAGVTGKLTDGRRYVRIGAISPHSSASIGFELNHTNERRLLLAFVRSVVMSSATRSIEESRSADSAFEQGLAGEVRSVVTEELVGPLFSGRLVVWLDARSPDSFSLAYEFAFQDKTYHIGVGGTDVMRGWVTRGPMAPSGRTSWGGQPLNLARPLTSNLGFGSLLPGEATSTPWEVSSHPSGRRLLIAEDLAAELGLGPDTTRQITFGAVLRRAMTGSLVLTSNLRRPPRTEFDLSEFGPPVFTEDAGDLPLELFRLALGARADREAYEELRDLFHELTGRELGLTATVQTTPASARSASPDFTSLNAPGLATPDVYSSGAPKPVPLIRIQPVIPVGSGEVSVEFAGAGVWEALSASAASANVPGRVVVLDEPATHLHPTWQRKLLNHLGKLEQVVLITHSPYLVPAQSIEDLTRVARFHERDGATRVARLPRDCPEGWFARWRRIVATSTESRAALFASGVVLLEGDTDLGAFHHWFSSPVVGGGQSPEALNLLLLPVGSDKAFGPYVSFLSAFEIPWVIICDGPVLSPKHELPLLDQLANAGVHVATGPTAEDFGRWKRFWERHAVFTVADRFGSHDKSGEIEAFFKRVDSSLWAQVYSRYEKSKVQAGFAFAEELDLGRHPVEQKELHRIWGAIVRRLGV